MKRTLPAVLLAVLALLGTAACTDDSGTSGDSVSENTNNEAPAPVPSSS